MYTIAPIAEMTTPARMTRGRSIGFLAPIVISKLLLVALTERGRAAVGLDAGKLQALLASIEESQLKGALDLFVGAHGEGIDDHARFGLLHLLHLGDLVMEMMRQILPAMLTGEREPDAADPAAA